MLHSCILESEQLFLPLRLSNSTYSASIPSKHLASTFSLRGGLARCIYGPYPLALIWAGLQRESECLTINLIPLTKSIRFYERQRLNERPIYFRSLLFMVAVSQSWLHISNDYDQVSLQAGRIRVQDNLMRPLDIEPPMVQLRHDVPRLLQDALMRATVVGVFGPFMYHLLIRPVAWPWTLYVARVFWSIPKDSTPPRIPPYHISLILRSAMSGLMLICLWQISNAVFQAFVAQPPLKNDQPLTADSRDSNGSLLNGLKSRKQASKVNSNIITDKSKLIHIRPLLFGSSYWSHPVKNMKLGGRPYL